LTASAVTSLPIPSPGKTAIFTSPPRPFPAVHQRFATHIDAAVKMHYEFIIPFFGLGQP
jgi:hypothetical protein